MLAEGYRDEFSQDAPGIDSLHAKALRCGRCTNGGVSELADVESPVPPSASAKKYLLRAAIGRFAANEWEVYAFPKKGEEATSPPQPNGNFRVIADISEQELQEAMARGERILLLGVGPFKSLPSTYRIGNGRLFVCSYRFRDDDPAARWLKACLIRYAGSSEFEPVQALSREQLHAVISAPLISGAKNSNVARNPSDPSSDVRAGELALP